MNFKYMRSILLFITTLHFFGMDVDTPPEERKQKMTSSSSSTNMQQNIFSLKTKDGTIIPVPNELLEHFENKIEIAREISDNMVLNVLMFTKEEIEKLFDLLKSNDVEKAISDLPEKEFLTLANISIVLDIPILKNSIQSLFARFDVNTFFVRPREEVIRVLSNFDELDKFYVQTIKKVLFSDFKLYLRDKNPFFKVEKKILAQVPSRTEMIDIAGNGKYCAWIDNQDSLHINDLQNNSTKITKNIGFQTANSSNFIINYTGSKICIAQEDEIKIFNTRTFVHTTKMPDLVMKIIPNNEGTMFFVETESNCILCVLDQTTGFIGTIKPLKFSHNQNIQESPEVLSACFSRDGRYLYVLYNNIANELSQPVLCIYITHDGGVLVLKKQFAEPFKCVTATDNPNEIWLGSNQKIVKGIYSSYESTMSLQNSIPLEGSDLYTLQSNITNTFVIAITANGTSLINIATQEVECEYVSLNHVVFGTDQKSIIGISKKSKPNGMNEVIYIPFRPASFATNLDNVIESLSLAQLFILQELEEQRAKEPNSSQLPITDFIQKIPEPLRTFVREYIFEGLRNDTRSTQSTEKQQATHSSS